MEITKSKFDNKILGIVLGLLIPTVTIAIQLTAKGYDFEFFLDTIKGNKSFVSGLLTICLVVNGIIFGILIQFKKQLTAIGLFFPTAIIGIVVLLYKFFG